MSGSADIAKDFVEGLSHVHGKSIILTIIDRDVHAFYLYLLSQWLTRPSTKSFTSKVCQPQLLMTSPSHVGFGKSCSNSSKSSCSSRQHSTPSQMNNWRSLITMNVQCLIGRWSTTSMVPMVVLGGILWYNMVFLSSLRMSSLCVSAWTWSSFGVLIQTRWGMSTIDG
jgi:hypothetical protein